MNNISTWTSNSCVWSDSSYFLLSTFWVKYYVLCLRQNRALDLSQACSGCRIFFSGRVANIRWRKYKWGILNTDNWGKRVAMWYLVTFVGEWDHNARLLENRYSSKWLLHLWQPLWRQIFWKTRTYRYCSRINVSAFCHPPSVIICA